MRLPWQLPRRRLLDIIVGSTLTIIGLVNIGALILAGLGVIDGVDDRTLLVVTLAVLSLLAVALGLERGVVFEAIERRISELGPRLDGIRADLTRAVSSVHVRGHDAVFRHTLVSIAGANRSLISLVVPGTTRAPEWWFDAVIEKLHDSKAHGEKITWHVYLAGVDGEGPDSLHEQAERRYSRLIERGIADQCTVWHVPYFERSGFDFFIIDGRITYLTLPSAAGTDLPHRCLVVDSTEVAGHLVEWILTLERHRLHAGGGPRS